MSVSIVTNSRSIKQQSYVELCLFFEDFWLSFFNWEFLNLTQPKALSLLLTDTQKKLLQVFPFKNKCKNIPLSLLKANFALLWFGLKHKIQQRYRHTRGCMFEQLVLWFGSTVRTVNLFSKILQALLTS